MTNKEFDTQFDIFYNNIASNAAPSVNSYEKSVFLTQAQRDIILGLYNGREVPGISFESTEEAIRYLTDLVKVRNIPVLNNGNNSYVELPNDLWFITLEEVKFHSNNECINNKSIKVIPVRQDGLLTTLDNPFKGPSERRVLRVDIGGNLVLYSKYSIKEYTITYIVNPNPIILEDLTSYGLTIEGKSEESESNINPILHRAVLERAVALAKAAYIGN